MWWFRIWMVGLWVSGCHILLARYGLALDAIFTGWSTLAFSRRVLGASWCRWMTVVYCSHWCWQVFHSWHPWPPIWQVKLMPFSWQLRKGSRYLFSLCRKHRLGQSQVLNFWSWRTQRVEIWNIRNHIPRAPGKSSLWICEQEKGNAAFKNGNFMEVGGGWCRFFGVW